MPPEENGNNDNNSDNRDNSNLGKKRPFLGNVHEIPIRILLFGGTRKGEGVRIASSWQATPLTWNPLRRDCGWWLCGKTGCGGWISESPWKSQPAGMTSSGHCHLPSWLVCELGLSGAGSASSMTCLFWPPWGWPWPPSDFRPAHSCSPQCARSTQGGARARGG